MWKTVLMPSLILTLLAAGCGPTGYAPPTTNGLSVSVDEDSTVEFTLTAEISEGGSVTWEILNNPTNGALAGTLPQCAYTPDPDYNGADSFTYKVDDGYHDSKAAAVDITVNPVNDPPTSTSASIITRVNTPSRGVTPDVLDVDDGEAFTFSIITQPSLGTATVVSGQLHFEPNRNVTGLDSFTYRAFDSGNEHVDGTASVTIVAIGSFPIADDQTVTAQEDISQAIVLTGSDPDGDELSYLIVSQPANGTLSGTPPEVTYLSDLDFNGSDAFTFLVNDGLVDSDSATVDITVNPVNDPPTSTSASIVTNVNTLSTGVTPSVMDVDDGESFTFSILTQPSSGTATLDSGQLYYEPNLNVTGLDSFTYRAFDSGNEYVDGTASVTIVAGNLVPVADSQSVTADEDTSQTIVLTGSDPDGDELSYTIVSQPASGTLSGTPPEVTYLSDLDYNGSDSFMFLVNDGSVDSNVATVNITVNPVNDIPVADSQSVAADEDVPQQIVLTGSDIDGDSLSFIIVDQPSYGTLSGSPPNVTYLSQPDYNGPDSFTFTVNDGSVDSLAATVSLTVYPRLGIWFVDIGATGTADGRSWANAFTHPQNGMDMAVSGEEVWVAGGTYASMYTTGSMPVLAMKEGVDIYGGFDGSETMRSERDLSSNITVLDGQYLVDNVVIGAGNATLDGFVITGGYTEATGGAGMSNDNVSGLTVMNSVFTGNESATAEGGGMYNNSVEIEIGNCVFTGNSAVRGGAINSRNSTTFIVNTTVIGNTASDQGGGTYDRNGVTSLVNSIVYDNAPDQIANGGHGQTVVTYSDVQQGGYAGVEGNINEDPLFSDVDFRLDDVSPCIDAGDNTAVMIPLYDYDLDGNERILDGDGDDTAIVDMGAYEFVP